MPFSGPNRYRGRLASLRFCFLNVLKKQRLDEFHRILETSTRRVFGFESVFVAVQ